MAELTPEKVKEFLTKEYIASIYDLSINDENEQRFEKKYNLENPCRTPRAILLLGGPGIGKTTVVYDTARKIVEEISRIEGRKIELCFYVGEKHDRSDVNIPEGFTPLALEDIEKGKVKNDSAFVVVDMRTTSINPEDLSGIPHSRTGEGVSETFTYYLPGWARVFTMFPGILFLDEINNEPREAMQAALYRVVQERRAGEKPLHGAVMIVAAGNPPNESSIARVLPQPLINRFLLLDVLPPTIDEWSRWMTEQLMKIYQRVPRTLYRVEAFLRANGKETLYKVPPGEKFAAFPTPRSWSYLVFDLSAYEKKDGSYSIDYEFIETICSGSVGKEIGPAIASFLQKEVISLKDILENPREFTKLPTESKYYITLLLADHIVSMARNAGGDLSNFKSLERLQELVTTIGDTQREFLMLILERTKDLSKGDENVSKNVVRLLAEIFKGREDLLRKVYPYIVTDPSKLDPFAGRAAPKKVEGVLGTPKSQKKEESGRRITLDV